MHYLELRVQKSLQNKYEKVYHTIIANCIQFKNFIVMDKQQWNCVWTTILHSSVTPVRIFNDDYALENVSLHVQEMYKKNAFICGKNIV